MKKDGFVSMTLVYTFLILFLFLMLAVLHAYTQQNKYLEAIDSKINLTINTPSVDNYCPYEIGQVFNYEFTNDFQTFISGCNGTYKIELWGAQGGGDAGGKGAYTSGNIKLLKDDTLYIYVGESPSLKSTNCSSENTNVSFNGTIAGGCIGGGGATDVRLVNGTWNNLSGLRSRIMVAAGGGGAYYDSDNSFTGGAGGGLVGYTAIGGSNAGIGGKQISNSYGVGTNATSNGGGGYYGGEAGISSNGGGGSSFISGHSGCIASASSLTSFARTNSNNETCNEGTDDIVCSYHYSEKIFTNTIMIDGQGYSWTNSKGEKINMPKYTGNERIEGNSGNGHAKITYISE